MSFEVLLCPSSASISIGCTTKIRLGSSFGDVCGQLNLCNEGAISDAMCYESSSRVLHCGVEKVLVSPTVGVVTFCSGRAPGKGFEALLSDDQIQIQSDPSESPSRYIGITLLLPMWQTELCFFGDADGKGALILQAIYVADEVEAGIPMTSNYHSRKTRFENTNEQITKTSLEIKYGAKNVTQSRGSLVITATHRTHTMRSIVKKAGMPSSLVCMSLPSFIGSILSSAQTSNDLEYSKAVLSSVSKRLDKCDASLQANIANDELLVIPGIGVTFCQSGVELRLKESTIQKCIELLGEPSTTVVDGYERKCGPWVDAQDGTRGTSLKSHDLDSSNPIIFAYLDLGLELTFSGCHRMLDRITLRNPIPSASRESLSSNDPYQIWKCTNGLSDVVGYDVRYKRPYFTVLLDVDLLTYFQIPNSERRAIVASNWTTWSEIESRFAHASQLESVSSGDQQLIDGMLKDLLTPVDEEVVLDGVAFNLVAGNSVPSDQVTEGSWDSYFQGIDKRFISALTIFASTTNSFAQMARDLATAGELSISSSQVGLNIIRELIQLPPRAIAHVGDVDIVTPDAEEAGVQEEVEVEASEVAHVVSESDHASKFDEEVKSKPTASSEHNSSTPAAKKGKKKNNKKNKKNQSANNSCSNSVAKSYTPSVSVPPSLCDEDEEHVDHVTEEVPIHNHASSSDIEQHQEVVDSHEMDHDATLVTDQNEKEHVEDEDEDNVNVCEGVTREYYEGDDDESQYPYTEATQQEEVEEHVEEHEEEKDAEEEDAAEEEAVEDEEHAEEDAAGENEEGEETAEVEEDVEEEEHETEKEVPVKKSEVSFTPSPSDDGCDSVPYLPSETRQDSSVEIKSGVAGVTSSWAAIAQHPPTPNEDDRTSDRMSPDSNRYMTCATEEAQTPPEANTPEFMSRLDAGDSLGSNQGSTSLIGRGMRPVSDVAVGPVVDVIEEDEESGGATQASSLPSLVPPSQSPGEDHDDVDSSNGDEVATKAHQSTSSASAVKTSATSSPPLSSQNTTASKRSKKKKRGGRK